MQIGVQFYTVRESCKTLEDFAETLRRVADIGYKTVQISGTCAYEPEWLDAELKKNGLQCVITHIAKERLLEEPAKVAAEHTVFGCNNIGLGWHGFPEPEQDVAAFIKDFTPVANALHENGKYFMYHNHFMEFSKYNGKPVIEHLAEAFSPEILGFVLDTYWVQTAGGDPAYWLEKLAGRIPCIHLKDHTFDRKMAAIGEGNINFDRVFEKAEAGGTQYMLVEQDNCNGEDPFDCLKRSYDFLKSRGFE